MVFTWLWGHQIVILLGTIIKFQRTRFFLGFFWWLRTCKPIRRGFSTCWRFPSLFDKRTQTHSLEWIHSHHEWSSACCGVLSGSIVWETSTFYLYIACPLLSCGVHAAYKTASFCGTLLQTSDLWSLLKSSMLSLRLQKEWHFHAHASWDLRSPRLSLILAEVYLKELPVCAAARPPKTCRCVHAQATQPSASKTASTLAFCVDVCASILARNLKRTWPEEQSLHL